MMICDNTLKHYKSTCGVAQIWISAVDKDHFRNDKHRIGINSHGLAVCDIDSSFIQAEDKVLRFTTNCDASEKIWGKHCTL